MRKTIKHIGIPAAVAACAFAFSACSKDDFISRISDTYSVQTLGSEDYFKRPTANDPAKGKVYDILEANGSVKYYINPNVPLISYPNDATSSAASSSYVRIVRGQMDDLGYTYTDDESQADLSINISNFQLYFTGIVWTPGPIIDPYFAFWGGYYPWLYVTNIVSINTNIVMIEIVDTRSLEAYRDWYQNTWVPSAQGRYPSESSVPDDKRPVTVWKCDISGELTTSTSSESTNDAYVFNLIPGAFSQSSYLDIN